MGAGVAPSSEDEGERADEFSAEEGCNVDVGDAELLELDLRLFS